MPARAVAALAPRSRGNEWLGVAVVVGAIWLGWQAVGTALVLRADPSLAVRVAPGSPTALRRAAQAEYEAGRLENAGVLARQALKRAPFDSAALRVVGLSLVGEGASPQDLAQADEILTLAGNWSLRDGAAHTWLVQQRLRQGDIASAFLHADALARRRSEAWPATFALFTAGAKATAQARAALIARLAAEPSWRAAYWSGLTQSAADDDQALAATLAMGLARSEAPLADAERARLYQQWIKQGRFAALAALRAKLDPSAADAQMTDGSFEAASSPPFGWMLATAAGLSAEVLDDEQRPPEQAMRIDYNGFTRGVATAQMLLLQPGAYQLEYDDRVELTDGDPRLQWRIRCVSGPVVATAPLARRQIDGWRSNLVKFEVPSHTCPAQYLELAASPGERRTSIVVWLDRITVSPRP